MATTTTETKRPGPPARKSDLWLASLQGAEAQQRLAEIKARRAAK